MGWKWVNGHPYYYKSVREGGRVRSQYYGGGLTGKLIAEMENIEREEREADRLEDREARAGEREIERALDALVAEAREAVAAVLTAAGYHQHHRGEWRKSRG
ncbi:MAG: hypothetical protein LC745_13540 [Planctomycetia bacterium]|nr:hypothetical protein [Planctomycetia bacterium]